MNCPEGTSFRIWTFLNCSPAGLFGSIFDFFGASWLKARMPKVSASRVTRIFISHQCSKNRARFGNPTRGLTARLHCKLPTASPWGRPSFSVVCPAAQQPSHFPRQLDAISIHRRTADEIHRAAAHGEAAGNLLGRFRFHDGLIGLGVDREDPFGGQ